jgi:hypothetical protein
MAAPSSTPRSPGSDDRSQAVESAILRSVTEHAQEWFPEAGPRPTVHLRQLVNRPRAALYAVHLDGSPRPQVLAKVRRDSLGGVGGGWAGRRPRLTAEPLPTSEMVALEHAGLRAIAAMIGPGHPSLAAVRPLAHLADVDTILMDYVDATTLRSVLLGQSRLPGRRSTSARPATDDLWRAVGAWLRSFQGAMPAETLTARQSTRDEVVERFTAYEAFLVDRLGRRALGDGACRGGELAARVLPERLSLAVGHGDLAPRNVFVLPDDRVAVFDPMPRWAVPRFEDLSRFLVGTRLLGLQLHTHGAAFSEDSMARRERQLIDGYAGAEPLPMAELRCVQLLVTLDHWSALVDTAAAGPRGRLRAVSARLATGYLRRETRRIADLIEGDAGGSRPA